MEVGQEGSEWETLDPPSLIQGLTCPVCWELFVKPHTLVCGHTFCLRCLQNLARIARTCKSKAPLDRLRFRCPSCRRMTMARPFLRRKAAVNYALRELMDIWLESPYSKGSLQVLTLRSVGTQTETPGVKKIPVIIITDTEQPDKESFKYIAGEEYFKILCHKMSVNSTEKPTRADTLLTEPAPASADESERASDVTQPSTSEEEESETDPENVPLIENIRIVEENETWSRFQLSRVRATSVSGMLAFFYSELSIMFQGIRRSRSRTILTIFWFLYGGLIVCMSRAFLPWMAFYTAIYFVILYAEVSPLFR